MEKWPAHGWAVLRRTPKGIGPISVTLFVSASPSWSRSHLAYKILHGGFSLSSKVVLFVEVQGPVSHRTLSGLGLPDRGYPLRSPRARLCPP